MFDTNTRLSLLPCRSMGYRVKYDYAPASCFISLSAKPSPLILKANTYT